jgi:hypothetical protein
LDFLFFTGFEKFDYEITRFIILLFESVTL